MRPVMAAKESGTQVVVIDPRFTITASKADQFFGINHMSQDKAQQLAEKYFDISAIFDIYQIVFGVALTFFVTSYSKMQAKDMKAFVLRRHHD